MIIEEVAEAALEYHKKICAMDDRAKTKLLAQNISLSVTVLNGIAAEWNQRQFQVSSEYSYEECFIAVLKQLVLEPIMLEIQRVTLGEKDKIMIYPFGLDRPFFAFSFHSLEIDWPAALALTKLMQRNSDANAFGHFQMSADKTKTTLKRFSQNFTLQMFAAREILLITYITKIVARCEIESAEDIENAHEYLSATRTFLIRSLNTVHQFVVQHYHIVHDGGRRQNSSTTPWIDQQLISDIHAIIELCKNAETYNTLALEQLRKKWIERAALRYAEET